MQSNIESKIDVSKFRFGYELECYTPLAHDQIVRHLRTLGMPVNDQPAANHTGPYDRWNIARDGSIRPGRGCTAYEIISPIMTYNDFIRTVSANLKWLKDTQGGTNETCGFHVGVSLTDLTLMRKITPSRITAALDEQKYLALWKRVNSQWCPSVRGLPYGLGKKGTWDTVQKDLNERIVRGKCTANFSKLPNYIEFRIMGGDLSGKEQLIADTVQHYMDVFDYSINPGEDTSPVIEYKKILTKHGILIDPTLEAKLKKEWNDFLARRLIDAKKRVLKSQEETKIPPIDISINIKKVRKTKKEQISK